MSASFLWQPKKPGKILHVHAPSSLREALVILFGEPPWSFTEECISTLYGLRAGLTHEREAIEELIKAISDYKKIDVWLEY